MDKQLLPSFRRYRHVALAGLLVACTNNSDKNTDSDNPNGTNPTTSTNPYTTANCEPQAWPIVDNEHQRDRIKEMWQDHPFMYWIPENPRAILVAFHGSGQNAGGMSTVEHEEFFNALAEHNIGYFAYDSAGEAWSSNNALSNEDYGPAVDFRDHLIASGSITADTPILSAGFSAGCGFNPIFAELTLSQGWDYRAFSCHVGSPYTTAPVPSVFYAVENDDPGDVRAAHETQLDEGFPSLMFDLAEEPLQPDRFTKIKNIDQEESQLWFDELVDFGFIDEQGVRLVEDNMINSSLNYFKNNSTGLGTERASAQLKVVWRQHAWVSERLCDELAFLEEHL